MSPHLYKLFRRHANVPTINFTVSTTPASLLLLKMSVVSVHADRMIYRGKHADRMIYREKKTEIGTKKILREILYQAYVLLATHNFGCKVYNVIECPHKCIK